MFVHCSGGSTNRLGGGGSLRKFSIPTENRPAVHLGGSSDCLSGQYGDATPPTRAVGSKGVRASARGTVKQGIRRRYEVFEEISTDNGLDSRKNSLSEETKAQRAEVFLRYQAEKLQDRNRYKSVFYDRVGPELEDPAKIAGALQVSDDDEGGTDSASVGRSSSVGDGGGGSEVGGAEAGSSSVAAGADRINGKSPEKRRSARREAAAGGAAASKSGGASELAERLTGSGPSRILWCNMREVQESGILETMTKDEIKLQEAQFEIVSSESCFSKSIMVLIEVFYGSPLFDYQRPNALVNAVDKHHLFSNIVDIVEFSASFQIALEAEWKKSPKMDSVGQVVLDNVAGLSKVYKVYCRNFYYQTKTLQTLRGNPEFLTQLVELERHPLCRRIPMQSYLEMPMKRIMSLQLLMDAVMRRMPPDSPNSQVGLQALGQLLTLARECDQESRMMSEKEQMLKLQNQLSFHKVKKVGCWGSGRHLIKEGQVRVLSASPNTQGFLSKLSLKKNYLQLHAFSDLLIVSKPKSDQDFQVLKHCPRAYVDAECLSSGGSSSALAAAVDAASPHKQTLRLRLVDTSDGTPEVTLMLELRSREEAERWMLIFSPKDDLGDPVYDQEDCPQAEAIHAYRAQQKDDLELRVGDIVNIYKKTEDGWFLGSRLTQLGFRGWFPGSHVREIANEHYKAKLRKVSFRRKSAMAAVSRHKL